MVSLDTFQALESADLKALITNVGSGVGAAPAAGGAFPLPCPNTLNPNIAGAAPAAGGAAPAAAAEVS